MNSRLMAYLLRCTALILLSGVLYLLWLEWRSPILSDLRRGIPIEILIVGLDEAHGTRRADMIILARVESAQARLKIMQIPRDTLVRDEIGVLKRINSFYGKEGSSRIHEALWRLLQREGAGFARRSITLDYAAFRRLYSSFGGMAVEGRGILDEDAALALVRSRGDGGDLERLAGQQGFYGSFLSEIQRKPWKLVSWMSQAPALRQSIQTDLSLYEMVSLAWHLRAWAVPARIYYFPLPGSPDPSGSFRVSQDRLGWLLSWWEGDGTPMEARPVRIEVLNATRQSGLALKWMRFLRSRGLYDVLYFGNAPDVIEGPSVLVVRQADFKLTDDVFADLSRHGGISLTVRIMPDTKRGVQFTLLLGEDAAHSPAIASEYLPAVP